MNRDLIFKMADAAWRFPPGRGEKIYSNEAREQVARKSSTRYAQFIRRYVHTAQRFG